MTKLQTMGTVYALTSPWDSSPTWQYERSRWLKKHFGMHHHNVIQTAAKYLVKGDLFVDDKRSHVIAWQQAFPRGRAVLFDMHHNQGDQMTSYWRGGWADVLEAAQRCVERPR